MESYLQGLKNLQQQSSASAAEDTKGFSVRFFEQDEHYRSELPNDEAFQESMSKFDGSELREALRNIQSSLGSDEEKSAFQAVLREVGGDMNDVRSADDLEKMMGRMDNYTRSIDAAIESAGSSLPRDVMDELRKDLRDLPLSDEAVDLRARVPQVPEKPWKVNQRKKISRLNLALRRCSTKLRSGSRPTKNVISDVYKAYHAARSALAQSWGNVPVDVWDLIWTVLSADEAVNTQRMAHVAMLSRDMSEARATLSPQQQLLAIEAIFVEGWESKAVENWKRCVGALGGGKAETFQDYWELGVRMFCRVGDMDQAERAADRLIGKHSDPRILMPLIRTYSERVASEDHERAWDTYRKMRGLLGRQMKLADYDQAISYFLTTNLTEKALFAFVDMMSDGGIDLTKLKYMPSVVANKFFLGKWLKRLIGAGDLDGAFKVIQFMRQRGVRASPIHLNGLIGAWQRSGGAADLECADKLAWDMVESRISFVRSRAAEQGVAAAAETPSASSSWPPATPETFYLLAENYRRRQLHPQMEVLWQAFRDAAISPDAFMMNQLLESHVQAGQPQDALELYRSLVTAGGVAPDPYTFSVLWKTLAINRLHVVEAESLPGQVSATRALFRETMQHRSVFAPAGIDGQLARKILHTLRRLGDKPGFLVALATFRQVLGFSPPETLILELVLQTTRLAWDTPAQRRRLIQAKRAMDEELLAWADGDPSRLEGAGGERQDALYDYLRGKYTPEGDDDARREAVMDAMEQMGVYELLTSGTEAKTETSSEAELIHDA